MNTRKAVFGLLLLSALLNFISFMQTVNSLQGFAVMTALLQAMASFCIVCLAYWVATDPEKHGSHTIS